MAVGVLPAPPTVGLPMQITTAFTRSPGWDMRRKVIQLTRAPMGESSVAWKLLGCHQKSGGLRDVICGPA